MNAPELLRHQQVSLCADLVAAAALCPCVTCALARQGDRRDYQVMLLCGRLRCAGATPKQRVEWLEYVATFGRPRVRAAGRPLMRGIVQPELPGVQPVFEFVCEHWRARLGTRPPIKPGSPAARNAGTSRGRR